MRAQALGERDGRILGRDHGKAPVINELAGFSVRGGFGEEKRLRIFN
jgi:hypothetical protein